MEENKPFYYNSSAGHLIPGVYLPVYHGYYQCL